MKYSFSLDSRSKDILLAILEGSTLTSLTVLAEQFAISLPSLQHSLQRINVWLEINGSDLQFDTHIGNFIQADVNDREKESIKKKLNALEGYSLISSPLERQHYLILSLLTNQEPVLTKRIAITLGVSRPTIFNDLDQVETWLKKFDIELIRKPGSGFFIKGREGNIRKAIEYLLLDTIGEMSLLTLYQGKKAYSSLTQNRQMLLENSTFSVETLDLVYCGNLVGKIEKELDCVFTDSTNISLTLFLGILIERAQSDQYIDELSGVRNGLLQTKEFSISGKVVADINERFNLQLMEPEQINLTERLLGCKTRIFPLRIKGDNSTIFGMEELEQIAKEMIAEAARYLHPILNIDQSLYQGLVAHLKPVINRLYYNQPIRNFLLQDIKKQYPYIYRVAKKISNILEEKVGRLVSDQEIGYIAMHLGAAMERLKVFSPQRVRAMIVCSGGCATVWMLDSRIRAEFPEIEIIGVSSLREFSQKGFKGKDFDIVITTIPLDIPGIPFLCVNPLLTESDIQQLHDYLNQGVEKKKEKDQSGISGGCSIMELLTQDTVQFGIHASNANEVIDQACLPLLRSGAIEKSYIENIKEVLLKNGPYMVLTKNTVLLHATIGDGVNKVCMGLSSLKKPVYFGHRQNDPVYLAFVLGAIDNHSHLKSLAQLSKLLGEREVLQELINADSQQTQLEVLSRYFNKSDYQKPT